MALAQQSVQGVSELVEGGLDLVDAHILGEVAYVHDDGADLNSVRVIVLFAYIVHPRAASLALAGEVVCGEDTDQRTVVVGKLIGGNAVGVVAGHSLEHLGVHSVENLGSREDSFDYVLCLEVRAGLSLVEVILCLADLLGIVPPVPLLDFGALGKLACLDILIHNSLHISKFFFCLLHCRSHNAHKEGIYGFGICGHLVGKGVLGAGLIAEDIGLAYAERKQLLDQLAVVVLVAVVAAHPISLVVLAAKLAVLSGGHLVGIGRHAEAELLCEGVGLGEYVVAYLLGKFCGAGVDDAQLLLLVLGETDAVADKAVVPLFEHHLLLAGKAALVGIIDLGNPVVEGLVEGDVVAVGAQKRYGLVLNGVESVAAVSLADIVEHALDLGEDAAGELKGSDGIVEGRSLGI